jgi:putative transposase
VPHPPKAALSNLVDSLKGVSSRYLRAEFTGPADRATMRDRFWSGSHFAGSCGGAPLQVVTAYIANRKRPT